MAEPFHVEDFEKEVLQAKGLVLIDFWAEWCGPCKMIAPIVAELANEYGDQMAVGKLDADQFPMVLQNLGIMGIPTLILFKDGQEAQRWIGYLPKDRIVAGLEPHLSIN
jgi:thioredoxin 1